MELWLLYDPTKSQARKPDSVDRTRGSVFPTQQNAQVICPKDDKHMYFFYRKPSGLQIFDQWKVSEAFGNRLFYGNFLFVSLFLTSTGG